MSSASHPLDRVAPTERVVAPVDSPCIKVCVLDDQQVCIGCKRTLDEIVAWGSLSDDARMNVLERLKRTGAERSAD
ncbi:MAG: DUF1289 domain-containing protein [Gammaproteobacteria bacterium]|jgi:predicted Fe-S protein YdhL (DUF1289 family)|nr:DUF1289 domain-containing protein [Gammaproteobacteria bacterium]